ncbi:MAG: hypothetical protein RLZZ574_1534, partial [Cyanobacteriota bacterium]
TIDLPKHEPKVQVDADIYDSTLAINVQVDDASDIATIDLPEIPEYEPYEPTVDVALAVNSTNNTLKVFVAVDRQNDSEIVSLPIPQVIYGIDGRDGKDGEDGKDGKDGQDGKDGEDGRDGKDGEDGKDGGSSDVTGTIDLQYENNILKAYLTVGDSESFDEVEILKFSPIDVEQITCNKGVTESKIVTVAVIKGTEAAELEAYAARAKIQKLQCESTNEVVSIVASDQVIAYAKGKLLVLHFVQLDNYPKRARGSTYWQVQIPAALDEYVWKDDFEDLRFERGNKYAELHFNEFKTRVSGFFASEAAANDYFDKVLDLTTATEKNRVFSKHKTPQTSVVQQVTRPYRAFIERVNANGRAECLIKYMPPIEEDE